MIEFVLHLITLLFICGLVTAWLWPKKKVETSKVVLTPEPEDKLTLIEYELVQIMARTKYGLWGEHVVTHRHINRALDLIAELRKEQND